MHPIILGIHPNNTIFSFNYHNIRHINSFLLGVKNQLGDELYFVDVGSGKSPYYSLFIDKVFGYTAVDVESSFPKSEERPIKRVIGFAENIPLENSIADIVLCNQVLEHVDNPIKSVQEIYRILKPGGKFIGSVPHVSPVHLEPYDYRRYTDLGLEKLLKEVGFAEIKLDRSGGVYSSAALMIAMDWMLSPRVSDQAQRFSTDRALFLSPLVGLINITALLLDKVFSDKNRSYSNLCWIAEKPIVN